MSGLKLVTVDVDLEYRKKWNCIKSNFKHLMLDGQIINENTLYREGGIFSSSDLKNDYFVLLKQVEEFYPDNITKIKKDKPHLSDCSCILNKYGKEIKVFNSFDRPWLIKNSVIYNMSSHYFNLLTGEEYCRASTSMESSEFLFLDNKYDMNQAKRGILKINKKDGSFELLR